MKNLEEVLKYFPSNIYNLLIKTLGQNQNITKELQEIRIRCRRPILLKLRQTDIVIDYIVTEQEILQTLERLCNN